MNTKMCPICGKGSQKKKTGSEIFEYKGQSITIPNYIAYECSECGETIVDNATLKKSGKILKDFQRKVDGLLTGKQIKAIRLKLDLTQEQLADIIGGGLKSVARYETGQVCQSKGMDNLLRILDAYPHTLKVIQKSEQVHFSPKVLYLENTRTSKPYKSGTVTYSSDPTEAAYGT